VPTLPAVYTEQLGLSHYRQAAICKSFQTAAVTIKTEKFWKSFISRTLCITMISMLHAVQY